MKSVKKKPDNKNRKKNANEDLKKLGKRIKMLRIKKGYTNHEKFAYDHNIDRVQFGRYERGVADMQYTSLIKVINALGTTLSEFFDDGFEQ